jgi:hypothetical protein
MIRSGPDILVDEPTEGRLRGVARSSSIVSGEALWFESADVHLRARPEAFASSSLVPALHLGSRLIFGAPLDPGWLQNCERLLAILHEWWGYPQLLPEAPPSRYALAEAGTRTALLFSGGVDSFYTLLRCPDGSMTW